MSDDGRLLVLLGLAGVAGVSIVTGSRGVVRKGRETEPELDMSFGGAGTYGNLGHVRVAMKHLERAVASGDLDVKERLAIIDAMIAEKQTGKFLYSADWRQLDDLRERIATGSRGVVRRGRVVPQWIRRPGEGLVLETGQGTFTVRTTYGGRFGTLYCVEVDEAHRADHPEIKGGARGWKREEEAMAAAEAYLGIERGSRGVVRAGRVSRWAPKDGDRVAVYSVTPSLSGGRPRYGVARGVQSSPGDGVHLHYAPGGWRTSRPGETVFLVEFTPGGGASWHTAEEDIRPIKGRSGSRGVIRAGRASRPSETVVEGWTISLLSDRQGPFKINVQTPTGIHAGGLYIDRSLMDWVWDGDPEWEVPSSVKEAAIAMANDWPVTRTSE